MDDNSFENEIKRLKKEIEFRDNQIDTLKKVVEGKKDSAILQQKINELTTYNEDLKKFQLDKDFQINDLNRILENKEKVKKSYLYGFFMIFTNNLNYFFYLIIKNF